MFEFWSFENNQLSANSFIGIKLSNLKFLLELKMCYVIPWYVFTCFKMKQIVFIHMHFDFIGGVNRFIVHQSFHLKERIIVNKLSILNNASHYYTHLSFAPASAWSIIAYVSFVCLQFSVFALCFCFFVFTIHHTFWLSFTAHIRAHNVQLTSSQRCGS